MAKLTYRALSKRSVESLSAEKDTVFWDRDLQGFGVRVYPSGSKVYVVQTRAGGKSKRVKVGRHGVLTADQARRRAASIIARVKAGEDPVSVAVPAAEVGPTVADLTQRYMREHVEVRCKAGTVASYRFCIERHILPALGALPVAAVSREQVAAFHHRLRATPGMANFVMDRLSHMFGLAEVWDMGPDHGNPCRSVRKYPERRRERFLSEAEYGRLGAALSVTEQERRVSPQAAAAIRLLTLTGCRCNEILTLRWEAVDLEAGELRLRDSKTGPRTVPLSPAAARILADLPRIPGDPWVIRGKRRGAHMVNILGPWRIVRARAGLDGVRIHDLRHSFASRALALGESLSMIGQLLGHRQLQTTARYAHLARDPVRAAAEKVADSIGNDIPIARHALDGA